MKKFTHRKRAAAIAATAALFLGGGAAWAWFAGSGSYDGTAGVGSNGLAYSISQPSPVTGLLPGAAAVAVPFTVSNTHDYAVHVNTVTATLPTVTSGADTVVLDSSGLPVPGCLATWFTVTGGALTVDYELTPGTGGTPTTHDVATGITVQMTDSGTDQTACAAASLRLHFAGN